MVSFYIQTNGCTNNKNTAIEQEEPEHKAWTINYFPGGWQAGHFHSTNK
jgi:hypothetical protein